MKQIKKIVLLFVAAIALQACYPGDSIPISDLDTVSTFYEPADFETPHATAAIMWDVVQIKNDSAEDLPYDGQVDDEILNTTLENMVSLYGATNVVIIGEKNNNGNLKGPTPSNSEVDVLLFEEDADDNPDLPNVDGLYAPSIMLREQTITYVYPGYPWYGGGWGCWYCSPCYYCGYPTVGYTTYEVGSVIIEMINIREIEGGQIDPNDSPISWIAVSRGLIGSDKKFNAQRTEDGINQAFAQSLYLK